MRIAVCDDEEKYRIELKSLLGRLGTSCEYDIDTFSNGNWLLRECDKEPYDLVFLDIEMPEIDGISLARKLRAKHEDLNIVFLTGHVEYAIEGYEVNALRYLTKPVQIDKLREVLQHVESRMKSKRQVIIREDGEELLIDLADIVFMEAQNQYVRICTVKGDHLIRYNIGDFENDLRNDGFFRTHRGYLVSLSRVKKLVKNDVIMEGKSGEIQVPVSRNNVKALKDALYAYVESEAF